MFLFQFLKCSPVLKWDSVKSSQEMKQKSASLLLLWVKENLMRSQANHFKSIQHVIIVWDNSKLGSPAWRSPWDQLWLTAAATVWLYKCIKHWKDGVDMNPKYSTWPLNSIKFDASLKVLPDFFSTHFHYYCNDYLGMARKTNLECFIRTG